MDVLKEDQDMMTTGTGDQNGVDLSSVLLEPRAHSLDHNNNNNSMIQYGEVAKGVQLSHVPVSESDGSVYTLPSDSSTNTLSSLSQSTLCSFLTTGKSAADLNNIISTGIYAHESTVIEKIRASKPKLITTPPEQKQATLSLKSMCTNETIDDDDDVMKAVSNEASNKLSRRISFESSIAPTRPSKKSRIEGNDVVSTNESTITTTTSIPLTLDAISSVGTTKVRSVSLPTPVTTAQPQQEQQQQQPSSPTLLAQQDQDPNFLNPLHVFIRNQIEVFTATTTELAQPAPGRKRPIQLNQVGLRCIHCRHLPNQKRVKRATCYPSSVGRLYHSVSDMKFDHFSNCKELPTEARETFESLKADGKRGSGHDNNNKDNKKSPKTSRKGHSSSTAQYYQDSASRMGMVDGPGGVIYMMSSIGGSTTVGTSTKVVAVVNNKVSSADVVETTKTGSSSFVENHAGVSSDKNLIPRPPPQQQHQQQKPYQQFQIQEQDLAVANSTAVAASMLFHPIPVPNDLNSTLTTEENNEQLKNLTATMSSNIMQSLLWNAIAAGANVQKAIDAANAIANRHKILQHQYHQRQNDMGKITVPLSAPEDSDVLNPVHCFVRKHVELFTADEHDIAAPSPGRKTRVQFRQVGIRCKHCVRFPFKERVKRAVCYPPSIDGIYHSVSNMKFDHLGICPGLPISAREEFTNIKKSYGRRVGGTNNNGGGKSTARTAASSSTTTGTMNTAQYYHDSAIAKGLVDTDKGIRFGNDVVNHIAAAASAGTPNTNMITARAQALYEHSTKLPTGISALMMAASQATSI
jgi:hypothetical protein